MSHNTDSKFDSSFSLIKKNLIYKVSMNPIKQVSTNPMTLPFFFFSILDYLKCYDAIIQIQNKNSSNDSWLLLSDSTHSKSLNKSRTSSVQCFEQHILHDLIYKLTHFLSISFTQANDIQRPPPPKEG